MAIGERSRDTDGEIIPWESPAVSRTLSVKKRMRSATRMKLGSACRRILSKSAMKFPGHVRTMRGLACFNLGLIRFGISALVSPLFLQLLLLLLLLLPGITCILAIEQTISFWN